MSNGELYLVSGGSGGIGGAVCQLLAARGYAPIVGYHRNREAAEAVAERCGGKPMVLDLRSEPSIASAVDELASDDAVLAGVVLAAGSPLRLCPFMDTSAADMANQWEVNVLGPQRLLSLLVRRCFRKARRGSVVGVLTKAMGGDGLAPTPGMSAYVIAKFGLAGILGALAADYPWLRVRSVKPGYTETPMLTAFDDRFLAIQRQRERFQIPHEVASQIVDQALGP